MSDPLEPAQPAVADDVHADPAGGAPDVDLDAVERDLNDVETALGRLDDGTYWTDEVTGEEIPDDSLADSPTARRV